MEFMLISLLVEGYYPLPATSMNPIYIYHFPNKSSTFAFGTHFRVILFKVSFIFSKTGRCSNLYQTQVLIRDEHKGFV